MGSLLVVTGPPGAGKSTLAEAIAGRLSRSVLVEGDAFFGFLRSGAIEPWLPESHDQNALVTQVAGGAAGKFANGGFETIYDGVVGPWFLDEFLSASGLPSLDYVVLLPSVETCIKRVLARKNHGFKDEPAARHMHDHFVRQAPADRHIINNVDQSPEELSAYILDVRGRGDLTYPPR